MMTNIGLIKAIYNQLMFTKLVNLSVNRLDTL